MGANMRPGERELEERIQAAFDRLPDPDPTRLRTLEARFVRQARGEPKQIRPRGVYWWLILGLVATGAAAWWSGTWWQWSTTERVAAPVGMPPESHPGSVRPDDSAMKETGARTEHKPSSTIYRRERP